MSAVLASKLTEAPDGEFSPMVPAVVRRALESHKHGGDALILYTEAHSHGVGWLLPDRQGWARLLGWTVHRVRGAITALRLAGLYIVERLTDAAGRFLTLCRLVATPSPQVTPEVESKEVGIPARIPSSRERKLERVKRARSVGEHSPATCQRHAAGLSCRKCGEVRAAAADLEAPAARVAPPAAALAAALPRVTARDTTRCDHGHRRITCLACASASLTARRT